MAVFSAILVPKNTALQILNLATIKSSDPVSLGYYTIFAINVTENCHLVFGKPTAVGTVNTSTTAVTWISGDKFTADMAGGAIVINKVSYTVSSVTDAENLVLTATAGTQTGVSYDVRFPLADNEDFFLPADQTFTFDMGNQYTHLKLYNPTGGNITGYIQPLSKF